MHVLTDHLWLTRHVKKLIRKTKGYRTNIRDLIIITHLKYTRAFGKFLAWHHSSTMPDRMLSNIFLETSIQQLLGGFIFVRKGLGVHVQHMLKMSRVYTQLKYL